MVWIRKDKRSSGMTAVAILWQDKWQRESKSRCRILLCCYKTANVKSLIRRNDPKVMTFSQHLVNQSPFSIQSSLRFDFSMCRYYCDSQVLGESVRRWRYPQPAAPIANVQVVVEDVPQRKGRAVYLNNHDAVGAAVWSDAISQSLEKCCNDEGQQPVRWMLEQREKIRIIFSLQLVLKYRTVPPSSRILR